MTRISFAEGRDAQPQALARMATHVAERLALPAVKRPLFCGIGASHAALALPVELLRVQGIPAYRLLASEITDHPAAFDHDLLVAVSQSGRSAETIAAFEATAAHETTKQASRTGERRMTARLALVNVAPSPLSDLADVTVDLGNEPDSFASTIGYTGTLVALDLIAAAIAGVPGALEKWSSIASLAEAIREIPVEAIASRAADCVAVDVVASGASRASAEETALLLREVPRIPSAASATRNYLHGEMESAGNTLHVILGAEREVELAQTLSAAGHPTLLVTTADVGAKGDLHVIRLPAGHPSVRVVLETIVAQELAATLANLRRVPIESFVFANNDTKQGGLDPADFMIQSSGAVA